MNYEESIEWLNTIPLSFDRDNKNYEFKLDGIKAFLSHLDNPQLKLKIIHIGGTNGKGSTCSIVSSILQEGGYKVGAFTSPHIKDFTERIRIGKDFICKDFVFEFIKNNRLKIETLGLTYFEISFAMAVDYFAIKKVDYAILEVGLGGRLDATNVVDPLISVITNIGYDHKEFLGDTLEEITMEKAGIIKYNKPVVVGEEKEKLQDLLKIQANKKSASIYFSRTYKEYKSDISGPFIQKNISLALKVLDILNLGIEKNDVINGILNIKENTKIYGRWELIRKKPKIIFDVGHNIDALKETLHFLIPGSKVVFGTLEKKDQIKCLEIFPKTMFYYFCPVDSPRSVSVLKLSNKAKEMNLKYFCFGSVESALKTALKNSKKNENILVTGSTFLFEKIINLKL